jgi:hypothetical protein
MRQNKWERRDKKRNKKRYGHREDGRSVKNIQRIQEERAEQARKESGNG